MIRLLPFLAGAAGGAALVQQQRTRRGAERFAAAVLETLLRAIDANDHETGLHVRRVARYALILAEAADLDDSEQRAVERVALFHDIGKIHEALFDIIHEHDELTREERDAIRTHAHRGAEVLAPLRAFYPELPEGVLSHHERWDGKGYPRQLEGTAIPFIARIVSIADTFDAITCRRRYSAARSARYAADRLASQAGAQFDPDLVALYLSPPVFERVTKAMRTKMKPEPRRAPREAALPVGDVTFRWRTTTPAPPAPDPRPSSPRE